MKRFQKILVPLQLAESDRAVLGMTSRIAAWASPAEILFCHFSPKARIPATLKQTHPWMFESIDQIAIEKMKQIVGAEGEIPQGTSCSFHVEAGNPVQGSLTMILDHDCDLVVVGTDGGIALGVGTAMALLALKVQAVQTHPSISETLTAWSYAMAKGKNVVNVILVDFRALDTLGEITVITLSAVGVYLLWKRPVGNAEKEKGNPGS